MKQYANKACTCPLFVKQYVNEACTCPAFVKQYVNEACNCSFDASSETDTACSILGYRCERQHFEIWRMFNSRVCCQRLLDKSAHSQPHNANELGAEAVN